MKHAKQTPKGNELAGWVTVSSKGQIAIPAGIRKEINIKTGKRLLVVVRKDHDGVNLIKAEAVDAVFRKFSK
jgi:AbrB family looped-hinge helix DNA binding protein